MQIKYLKELPAHALLEIIVKLSECLTDEQLKILDMTIEEYKHHVSAEDTVPVVERMSREFVAEKTAQIEAWMDQIDEGELYLSADGYEDYSGGYWESEWVTEYFDNQNIGNKLTAMIQFAKDCVNDRKYQEANMIYEWLWDMAVSTDEDDGESADLEMLAENDIIREDLKQIALLTLYTDYQIKKPDERAADLYLYFTYPAFQKLCMEEMFHAGRENLTEAEQFWNDWIALLKNKTGDVESRLLKEAVLHNEGVEGLVSLADENCAIHPSLYLEAMKEYDSRHNYLEIERIGEKAVEKLQTDLIVRSEIMLKAAYAASCLGHEEKLRLFCWESFRSNSTTGNLLRLYGTNEMAEQYGVRTREVLRNGFQGNENVFTRNMELRKNHIGEFCYYTLSFYAGDFATVKKATKNPKASLGWSSSYVGEGIRLFLLYLYENPLPSKAAAVMANQLNHCNKPDSSDAMSFENEIMQECHKREISIFWNYFQRWKHYFPMETKEKRQYLAWAEKIVYDRADAIVSGQHRRQYMEVAVLLAVVAEIKAQNGEAGAKREIFAAYKRKFPRHSSFQAEMKAYFGIQ